jgi:hypothetical protein
MIEPGYLPFHPWKVGFRDKYKGESSGFTFRDFFFPCGFSFPFKETKHKKKEQ